MKRASALGSLIEPEREAVALAVERSNVSRPCSIPVGATALRLLGARTPEWSSAQRYVHDRV